ncbi:patatin-like phospholipase family protein [candidate division CSSED10-310 bacterium]|uniref:Patatin-like phospholipase family protein n=1 Tax=candidate division CSSED10-310 bacterium TaxID=2855610 RepID=A0ABV6Z4U3_UNCC1
MNTQFRSIVFAGGGNRCLWQAGFWSELAPALSEKPQEIAAVSAGATVACMLFANKFEHGLEHFMDATHRNEKNIYVSNIVGSQRVFPHFEMYKRAILTVIDQAALELLHQGPDIRIQIARPPDWLGPLFGTLVGFGCYTLEKWLVSPVHPGLASSIDFKADVISIRDCSTPEQLCDLLLCSSCTPPLTPIMSWDSSPALDGGLVDNVPVNALPGTAGKTLVLLTRQYSSHSIPREPNRIYVHPSRSIPVNKWDYTCPEGLQAAYQLGKSDGRLFIDELSRK